MLWLQLFGAYSQGKQNFLWCGWSTFIFNGIGRVAFGGAIVVAFHGQATPPHVRGGLRLLPPRFAVFRDAAKTAISSKCPVIRSMLLGWLKRVAPLTAGASSASAPSSSPRDAVIAQNFWARTAKELADYMFGSTLCRKLSCCSPCHSPRSCSPNWSIAPLVHKKATSWV